MRTNEEKESVHSDLEQKDGTSRRTFLQRSALAGAAGVAGVGTLLSLASPSAYASGE